jgi:hypothetical protein
MKTRVTKFVFGAAAALLLSGVAQNSSAGPHCLPISGTVMTNLGVVNASTTLGVVDGDLKGAVAATILTGVATATATQVAPGLSAIYPVHVTGGTGKFAGATSDFNNIGAGDFVTGRTIFRYSGQVCFPESD